MNKIFREKFLPLCCVFVFVLVLLAGWVVRGGSHGESWGGGGCGVSALGGGGLVFVIRWEVCVWCVALSPLD